MKKNALPILTCALAVLAIIFIVTTVTGNNKNGALNTANASLTEQLSTLQAQLEEQTG